MISDEIDGDLPADKSQSYIIEMCQPTFQALASDPDLWDAKLFYGINVWNFKTWINTHTHIDPMKRAPYPVCRKILQRRRHFVFEFGRN